MRRRVRKGKEGEREGVRRAETIRRRSVRERGEDVQGEWKKSQEDKAV